MNDPRSPAVGDEKKLNHSTARAAQSGDNLISFQLGVIIVKIIL